MAKKAKQNTFGQTSVRKATPEEVARYNEMLSRESSRMQLYRDMGISYRVNMEGNYSTTAVKE